MEQIKLSNRLQLLADLITFDKAADIGTDHGFLPIYLIQSGKCKDVILSDVNEGPLKIAHDNLLKYHIDGSCARLRLGSGLQVLEAEKGRSVIIAGMGGELISDILEFELEKSRSFEQFILQPRTREAHLRKWLLENGFMITDERLVQERGRICQVICAEPSDQNITVYEDFYLEYPEAQFDGRNGSLANEYAAAEILRLQMLIRSQERSSDREALAKAIESNLKYIDKLKEYLK